jgi:hypothetical protein
MASAARHVGWRRARAPRKSERRSLPGRLTAARAYMRPATRPVRGAGERRRRRCRCRIAARSIMEGTRSSAFMARLKRREESQRRRLNELRVEFEDAVPRSRSTSMKVQLPSGSVKARRRNSHALRELARRQVQKPLMLFFHTQAGARPAVYLTDSRCFCVLHGNSVCLHGNFCSIGLIRAFWTDRRLGTKDGTAGMKL